MKPNRGSVPLLFTIFGIVGSYPILAQTVANSPRMPAPFKAEYRATLETSGSEPRLLFTEARFYSTSGRWRTVQTQQNNDRVERFGKFGEGEFEVDEKNKRLLRRSSRRQADFPGSVGASRRIGSDRILGFETEIFEYAGDGVTILLYRAPELNGGLLKFVRKTERNTFVLEATRVFKGEPEPELLESPSYPVIDAPVQRPN